MGVSGLMDYIKKHPNRDKIAPRVDLVELARGKRAKDPTGEGKALLLCDYAVIVRELENAVLRKQPRICHYYGCDTRLLSQQIELFVKCLRSIGVEPVFYCDGPADKESFKAKFEEKKIRQVQKLERSKKWEKAIKEKSGDKPEFNIPHPLCYTVCDYALQECQVKCLISYCEADVVLIDHFKTTPNALGILSNDTDFAVADGCCFLPLDFFDCAGVMGFHRGDIHCHDAIKSLPCRYTSPDILAECLGLSNENIPWFAMLCGNDYTRPCGRANAVRVCFRIDKKDKTEELDSIAQWIRRGNPQQNVRGVEGFNEACQFSKDLYSGKLRYASPTDMKTTKLSSVFFSIEKGIYWWQPVAEAPSLKLPLSYTVSQPIRRIAYALYGRTEVTEYGHRSYKPENPFHVRGHKNLSSVRKALQRCGVVVRAAALHHLVSSPQHSLDEGHCAELQQSAPEPADLPPDEQDVLRGIIVVSTLAYLASVEELRLEENKIRASLLAIVATTAGVRGDVDIGKPDPDPFLRAVSLSSTISVSLLSLYYIAELLDLAPKASDIFCSSVFVPAYMAVMQHLPAGISALAPVVSAVGSPHTTELMGCIRTMGHSPGKLKLTPPDILTGAVCSYTELVRVMRALVLQQQQ